MTEDNISDLITDQEMEFVRLILSGTMADRDAAQSAGLNPDKADYTKSKPCVRAYMKGHRAAVQQPSAGQETVGQSRPNQLRERLMTRLLEIADAGPQVTRGSFTSQVKAISLIMAMEGLIPARRAAESKSAPSPVRAQNDPEPSSEPAQKRDEPGLVEPVPESALVNLVSSSEMTPSAPYAPPFASAPDTRVPFQKKKKRWRR